MSMPIQFSNPPVVEVACGVLFAQSHIQTAHIGAFWERVKSDFPQVADAVPLAAVIEDKTNAVTEIGWADLPPLRRAWLISEDGGRVIQVQQDRFLFNWKRTLTEDAYPSYEAVVEEFERHLNSFLTFLAESNVESPSFRQFDLTYINHITSDNGLDRVGYDGLLVDHLRASDQGRFLPPPDGFNWATSYPLPAGEGRLHIVAQSAEMTATAEKIVRLDLTARGMPSDSTEHGRRTWFNMAHDWITHGFADVTSTILHKENWKRTS